MTHRYPILLLAFAIAGCQRTPDDGPIEVSVIGAPVATSSPNADRGPFDAPASVLLEATGQGLVRFDASGQIVPGLAARWIVTDSGRGLIFRLPDASGSGEKGLDAERIARRIRAAIAANSRNALKPLLGAIEEVDAVTPQVIDVELTAPRPNMLQLFAQPALAIGGGHGGPFSVVGRSRDGALTLQPLPGDNADEDGGEATPLPLIRLRGEAAGRAVARFVAGRSALMLGGRFSDLPILRVATLPRNVLHFDPVTGLFGLAFARTDQGFTADAANRRALAMAIDRERIAHLLAVPGWKSSTAIVASGTPEIEQPALPDWTAMPLDQRQAAAHAAIETWAAGKPIPPLRIALPAGPGARLLFAAVAADWRAIGMSAIAVGPDDPADLRLIDEVAPADVASFYLRAFACDRQVPCTPVSDQVLVAARDTPSLAERSVLLTQADALIAQTVPFIPFGPPVRWSLVTPGLDLYRDSPRGMHPLNELRSALKR